MYKQLKTLKDATVSLNCKSGHEDNNLAPKYSKVSTATVMMVSIVRCPNN